MTYDKVQVSEKIGLSFPVSLRKQVLRSCMVSFYSLASIQKLFSKPNKFNWQATRFSGQKPAAHSLGKLYHPFSLSHAKLCLPCQNILVSKKISLFRLVIKPISKTYNMGFSISEENLSIGMWNHTIISWNFALSLCYNFTDIKEA